MNYKAAPPRKNSHSKKTPERQDLRRGDWICIFCHNHNFSFRQVCNRC